MLALHTNGLITAAGVLSAGVASTALATARLRSLRPSSAEVIAIIAVALTLATSLLILLGIINANQRPHGRDGASSLQPAIQAGPAARSAAQRQAESLRVDPSQHFLGLRLNTYVAAALTLAGAAWFTRTQPLCLGNSVGEMRCSHLELAQASMEAPLHWVFVHRDQRRRTARSARDPAAVLARVARYSGGVQCVMRAPALIVGPAGMSRRRVLRTGCRQPSPSSNPARASRIAWRASCRQRGRRA